jgi:anti-sigma-K factor RskA
MEDRELHDLTAAYALDALDEDERGAYEAHLPGCTRCREELADLAQTAALLAHGAPAATPPPALRERILEEAHRNRGGQVLSFPRRPRIVLAAAGTLAAAAAAIAIVAGVQWASVSDDLDDAKSALSVLADPEARSVPLEGAKGRLVVDREGSAAIIVGELDLAPSGRTYELWVIRGDNPRRAGLFEGGDEPDLVLLEERVDGPATVAVTLERDGGVDAPTGRQLFSATT